MNTQELTIKLFESLKRFNKGLIKYDKMLESLNINDLLVCGLILKNETENKLTQAKDISDYLQISRPAVNTILNRLEDRSIIERCRLKEDRRSVYLKLTANAHHMYANERLKIMNMMSKVVDILGYENTKILIELLCKVNNIMEEEVE